jgi:hypothetical protein
MDSKKEGYIVSLMLGVAAIAVCIIGVFSWGNDNKRAKDIQWCEQHGGTWFHHEGKCIDVHEIKVPE